MLKSFSMKPEGMAEAILDTDRDGAKGALVVSPHRQTHLLHDGFPEGEDAGAEGVQRQLAV